MKPILFNTEMVMALLENRKTVTRRICKDIDNYNFEWGLDRKPYLGNYKSFERIEPKKWGWVTLENVWQYDLQIKVDESKNHLLRSPYQIGDVLYVRETFNDEETHTVLYAADKEFIDRGCKKVDDYLFMESEIRWKPSIHMPKKLARIFLKVTDIRVERLSSMLMIDFLNEGIELYRSDGLTVKDEIEIEYEFEDLWNSTIKKQDLDRYGWDSDPWVWVIEFETIS